MRRGGTVTARRTPLAPSQQAIEGVIAIKLDAESSRLNGILYAENRAPPEQHNSNASGELRFMFIAQQYGYQRKMNFNTLVSASEWILMKY